MAVEFSYVYGEPVNFSPVSEVASSNILILDYAASVKLMHDEAKSFRRFLEKAWTNGHVAALDYLTANADKPLPADLVSMATQYAPRLVATMRDTVRRMARHQTAGALDTSKLVRLARPSSAAQFDRDAANAFRARTNVPRETPLKLAIVADMNNKIRTVEPSYNRKVATLAHILSDAASVAGLQCAAYAARGQFSHRDRFTLANEGKPVCLLTMIKDYNSRISPRLFRAFAHNAFSFASSFLASLNDGGTSYNGTGAIDYVREHDKATFVVAIGDFSDKSKADVLLSPYTTLDDAISQVHAALQARNINR